MTFLLDVENWANSELHKVARFFGPIAAQAEKAGVADLMGDAATVAAQVAADPSLVTDGAKRDAAIKALGDKVAAQGATLSENTIAAAAATALAALPATEPAAQPEKPAEPQPEQPAAEPAAESSSPATQA